MHLLNLDMRTLLNMYKFIKTQQRPTVDTPFFFENYTYPKEYNEYINKNYIDTKKLLGYQKIESPDKIKVTHIITWNSRVDFLSYITDDYIFDFIAKAHDYDINNDIVTTIEIEKEPK